MAFVLNIIPATSVVIMVYFKLAAIFIEDDTKRLMYKPVWDDKHLETKAKPKPEN